MKILIYLCLCSAMILLSTTACGNSSADIGNSEAASLMEFTEVVHAQENSAAKAKISTTANTSVPIENAAFTTSYDPKKANRTHNLSKAAAIIDGIIINPDETFSFNNIIGNAGKAEGYKPARIFVRGVEKEGYGGGICQVSSTLFNAADSAGLKIVERHPHSKRVHYVEEGRDAATAFGSVDLKIKNVFSYPVVIFCKATDGKLTVTLEQII